MDIDCDKRDGFGVYRLGDDADLMREISSANIACGFHAGDPQVMDATVRLAAQAIKIDTGSETRQIPVDTLCIHGDSPTALAIARAINARLKRGPE